MLKNNDVRLEVGAIFLSWSSKFVYSSDLFQFFVETHYRFAHELPTLALSELGAEESLANECMKMQRTPVKPRANLPAVHSLGTRLRQAWNDTMRSPWWTQLNLIQELPI